MSDLSWLNPTPHAIAVYASRPLSPVATQHSLPSGRYPLLGPDFHRLDRTSLRLAHSLDHLVGAGRQCGRHFEAQQLCGAQIDDEFELGWPHDRQVGGMLALENPRSIDADLTISVGKACSITHETAGRDVLAQFIDRWNGVVVCKRDQLLAPAVEKGVAPY